MKKLLGLGLSAFAMLWVLFPSQASASTLTDCLAQQHVCVTKNGHTLISAQQQAQLEQQIGSEDIYLVVAASGAEGYDTAMNQIIAALNGHKQFTVAFLDSRQNHFGAYNKGMLPSHGAADIATRVVEQHQADQNIFAALTDFVSEVQQEAVSGSQVGSEVSAPSHTLRNVVIAFSVVFVLVVLGFFLIARPIRERRLRDLKDAKSAAQDDLIALSTRVTDLHTDASIQNNQEAAAEQSAALSAYERGTMALDAARRPSDMGAVSRAIAAGQYHAACAEALAAGKQKPARRPSCFFDPRHGMSVNDVEWAPPYGGPSRSVPACIDCAHKADNGIEPEMRRVDVYGAPVDYVNTRFAPAYWGGYGFGHELFAGFLLGQLLAPNVGFFGGGFGGFGGGEFGGGDGGGFGGGDFGGGDFGGGGGGGDFGGGGFS